MEIELEAAMAAATLEAAPVDAQPVPAALVPGGAEDGGMASSLTAESLRRARGAELSDEDATWLADARGRKLLDQSAIVIGVAARRPEGQPRVLTMYPLRCADHAVKHGAAPGGGKAKKWLNSNPTPWPNMFWLVDPSDQMRVGRLEHQGYVKTYRAKLLADPVLLARFESQHKTFAAQRWALLSDTDKQYAEVNKYSACLRDSGVGGVNYLPQVKCLHAHYAHYLATGNNLVGKWVEEALQMNLDLQSKNEAFKTDETAAECAPAGIPSSAIASDGLGLQSK